MEGEVATQGARGVSSDLSVSGTVRALLSAVSLQPTARHEFQAWGLGSTMQPWSSRGDAGANDVAR